MYKKTLPVQSRLDNEHFELLTALAMKKGVSISLMVRMILIAHLEVK